MAKGFGLRRRRPGPFGSRSGRFWGLQILSVVGALAVVGAFAAHQLGWIGPSRLSYALANCLGAGLLTVVAVADGQVGFIFLQGAWTLIGLWGTVAILRSRKALPLRGAKDREEA